MQTYPRHDGKDQLNRQWEKIAGYCAEGQGLDIGCGSWKVNWQAIGVDSNPLVQPDLLCDAIRLPYPDDSMDFVASIHSLEHFWYSVEALTEWSRVLKPGGHMCIVMQDKRSAPMLQSEETVHQRYYTPDELHALVGGMPWLEVVQADTIRDGHSFDLVCRKATGVPVPPAAVRPPAPRGQRALTILWSGYPDLQRAARAMGHHIITIGHWDYTDFKYPLGSHVSLPRMLEELRAIGVEVDLVVEQEANFFFADLDRRPSWLPAVHTVCNAWDFNRIERCRLFDFNFISQNGFLDEYRRRGNPNTWWLPHWADPDIFRPFDLPEEFDVGTLGRWGRGTRTGVRGSSVPVVGVAPPVHQPEETGGYWWEEAARFYARCRIVFNRSAGFANVNERPFHVLACGKLMLTDRVGHGLTDLFENHRHLAIYNDERELLDLVDHYLRNPEERRRVAEAGRQEVLNHHTPVHRMDFILRTVFGDT